MIELLIVGVIWLLPNMVEKGGQTMHPHFVKKFIRYFYLIKFLELILSFCRP